jgi:phage tail-like protein
MANKRVDPFPNYNFYVEIDNVIRAGFQEATGLEATIDVVEYAEGGKNFTPHKLPGRTKYADIVLKWGVADDLDLYNWHRQMVLGATDRRNGSIICLDRTGNEVARWNFFNAWPTKYHGPDFNAKGNDVAIETLELAHEGLERVK